MTSTVLQNRLVMGAYHLIYFELNILKSLQLKIATLTLLGSRPTHSELAFLQKCEIVKIFRVKSTV